MNIIHLVSNKVWGGGERYALDLCKALRADGHRVSVFTRNRPAVRTLFAAEQLLAGTMRLGGPLDILTPLRLASRLNHTDGPVIIHVHNFKDAATAISARRLCRSPHQVKIIATRHLVKAAKTDPSHTAVYAALDAIVFVSRLALDEFLSSDPEVDRSRLHVIHNAVAIPPCPRANRADGPVNLIFAGRIVPEKGLGVLIEALGKLQDTDWRLTVCGTGSGKDVMPLVARARQLGIDSRIDWKGHVDNVIDEFAQADVAIAPSIWREPFGLTILEAMSQGLPVITTDNGAQREFMKDGADGILVPPSNPTALAAAISRLVSDPALRADMGRHACDPYTARLSYDRFYKSILALYNGL